MKKYDGLAIVVILGLMGIFQAGAYYEEGPTYLEICPVYASVLDDPYATAEDLADWYQPTDGDYAGFVCPTSDVSQCPGGIARWDGQCTHNEMTASQYIDPGCVVKVRNYKLKIIVDNNYCPRPAAWDPTTNPDGSINLPTEEEPVIQHEQMSNNINLTSYIYNPQVDYTNSIVEYYGGIQAQTEVTQNSGDPVDLARGAMVWSNTLMDEPTEGEDFQLVVTYDNQASYNGIMGRNRDHNWNQYLTIDGSTITYYDGYLHVYKFVQEGDKWTNASDMEISQSGDEYILHIVGANAYQVFASQGEDIVPWRMVRYTIHNADYALSYDDEGYLTTITDPHGRNIIFSYEELNPSYPEKRLTHIAHANGRSVDITYYGDQDSDGVLGDIASFVVNHENQNQTINLTYNSDVRYDSVTGERVVNHLLSHQLATIDDNKDNIYVDNTYDAHDRVIQQAYGDQILSYTYTDLADGNLQVDITDRRGQTATHVYDAYYRLLSLTDQSGIMYHYEYDGIGHQVSQITYPDDSAQSYTYDDQGNITSSTISDGDESLTETFTYDSNNLLTEKVDSHHIHHSYTYDDHNNLTSYTIQPADSSLPARTTTISYTDSDKPDTITLPYGQQITYTYNEYDLPLTITQIGTDGSQITQTISYDDFGNPRTITDGEGHTTTLTHDEWDRLTGLTTPEAITLSYSYDDNHNLTSMIQDVDGAHVDTTFDYDILDNLTSISTDQDADTIATTIMEYDPNDNLSSIILPEGLARNYTYDSLQRLTSKSATVDGQLIKYSYDYDTKGRLISITDPEGHETTMTRTLDDMIATITTAEDITTFFEYDDNRNMITRMIVSNYTPQTTNYILLQQRNYTYDARGQLTQVDKVNVDNTSETLSMSYTYDQHGKIIAMTDQRGAVTTMTYDAFARPETITDAVGKILTYEYDDDNLITKQTITTAEGKMLRIANTYDDDHRLIQTTNHMGQTFSYVYNGLGQITQMTDAEGNTTEYEYDYWGNVTQVTQHDGSQAIVTTKTYDRHSNLISLTDDNGNITTWTYDDYDRLIQQALPDGAITTYTYDADSNIISSTDPNGSTVAYTYDDMHRITQKDIDLGPGVGGVTQEHYTYDELGRVTSITDDLGHDLTFSYDSLDRLTSESQSNLRLTEQGLPTQTISHSYYADTADLQDTIYPSGKTITNQWDILGRMTDIQREGESIIDYLYDSATLTSLTRANDTTTSRIYDDLLRPTSLSHDSFTGGPTTEIGYTYTYDLMNNILTDGHDQYYYDDIYQITTTAYNIGDLINGSNGEQGSTDLNHRVQTYTYDGLGNRVTEYNDIAGITILDRLHQKANSNTQGNTTQSVVPNTDNGNNGQSGGNSGNGPSGSNGNNNGNGNQQNQGNGGNGNHYGRGTGDDTGGNGSNGQSGGSSSGVQDDWLTISPDYNGVGAVTDEYQNTYNINNRNQYEEVAIGTEGATGAIATSFAYDQNGNLIENDKRTFTYDYQNRLIKANLKDNPAEDGAGHPGNQDPYKIEYSYDPLGRRTSKRVYQGSNESRLITYVYDGQNIAQEHRTYESNDGQTFTKEYVYGARGLDDIVFHELTRNDQVNQYYYYQNHQGSIIALSNQEGKIVESYRYDTRGNIIFGGSKNSGNTNGNPSGNQQNGNTSMQESKPGLENYRLYTAREYEAELDLYYYRARYYSPRLGRFISSDPLLYIDGPNPYSYVRNNSVNYMDAWGLESSAILYDNIKSNTFTNSINERIDNLGGIDIDWSYAEKYNYGHRDRQGEGIQAIILHQTNATTLESTLDYTRPKGTASAHYIIDTDGQIYGTLDPDTQIARHNGANEYCVNTLREYVYNGGVDDWHQTDEVNQYANNNQNTIGIENVGMTGEPLTSDQLQSLKELTLSVANTYGLSADDIYAHPWVSCKNIGEATSFADDVIQYVRENQK